MNFLDTFREMLAVLFAILAGYTANRCGYIDKSTEQKLSGLALNISTPILVLNTVFNGEALPGAKTILNILLGAAVFYAVEFAVAFTVPYLIGGTDKQKGVWRFVLSFPNIGFIGYPVVTALFGSVGLFYAVILALPFNMLSYSLGPLMVSGQGRLSWKQFCSPAILASIAALVLALVGWKPPEMIGHMTTIAASVHVPLSLMVLGSLLAGMSAAKVLRSFRMWAVSALRLLVLPGVLALVLRLLGAETMLLNVAVVQMAMPVAVSGTMMCVEFGGDTESMAQITFLTTVLSIVTIPLAASLFL